MWTSAIRGLFVTGTVRANKSDTTQHVLAGVAVDVFNCIEDPSEASGYRMERLNKLPALTDATGSFEFGGLTVPVMVRNVSSPTPPYDPMEIVLPKSLPNLAFLISSQDGANQEFIEIYDETESVNDNWFLAHPSRRNVPLTSGPNQDVEIPYMGSSTVVPTDMFYFLRLGRATREEFGDFGTVKPGYMTSSPTMSFLPGVVDAPVGGRLHIGGHFGAGFQSVINHEKMYYTIHFSEYSGNPSAGFSAPLMTNKTQIVDTLENKRFVLPTPSNPKGNWEKLSLGPFDGVLEGTSTPIRAYRRPPEYDETTHYYPFYDLMVEWNSNQAPNKFVVLEIALYEDVTPAPPGSPLTLRPLAMGAGPAELTRFPLTVDNHQPIPVLHPYDSIDPEQRKFHHSVAHFVGVPETLNPSFPIGNCNEFSVIDGPSDGNECLMARYSVEDGTGSPHAHVLEYGFFAEFTPKSIPGAPDSKPIALKPTFAGHSPIQGVYPEFGSPPTHQVDDQTSVLVPSVLDSWPPEGNGDTSPQCPQYALEVALGCRARTINGWGRLFGRHHVSRHLIVKKN